MELLLYTELQGPTWEGYSELYLIPTVVVAVLQWSHCRTLHWWNRLPPKLTACVQRVPAFPRTGNAHNLSASALPPVFHAAGPLQKDPKRKKTRK